MQLFATDRDRLEFLLEAEAELRVDPERLSAEARQAAREGERPRYVTNYIGSKQKLVEWIWKNTPEAVESVIDAFSGSAVVAYMYKSRGLKVVANDRLRYAWHTARAIIENDKATLSVGEIDALLADNPKAGTFVRDTFKGIFFEEGVHAVIDAIRANCDALSGYKKDLALFALGKSCASGGFGHFTSTQESGLRKGGPDDFKERFRRNAERINALVFANGEDCKAVRRDVNEVLPETKADLAYFDPPYATEFSTTNYERAYHFVEGLMTYWEGLKIVGDSKTKFFESDHETVTKGNAKAFFERMLGGAKHLGHWLISYRDHAYPNEEEMKGIIGELGRETTLKSTDHQYLISGQNNEASKAKEYLFICSRKGSGAQADATDTADSAEGRRIEDNLAALADAPLGEAVDLLSCMAADADSEPVRVTGYLGSKFVLLGWMEKLFPKDAKSVLDAFSGGANVAYHLKRKGLKVYANDLLRFPYHLARAVIENSAEKLTDEEIDRILAPNPDAGSFIEQTFHGYYYTKPVLRWLDQVWANIQRLPGYKKDIALAALGTTVKAKSAFGHFTRSKMQRKGGELDASASLEQSQLSNPPVGKFIDSFRRSAKQLNALVFDNGQECKAFNLEASEAVKQLGADLLYLDPPYVTDFATNDYEDALHFVEGLMTRWADKELLDNPRKSFRSRTRYNKESMRELMETLAAGARGRFGSVALSYRDKAYPDEESIKALLGEHYGAVKVHGMEVDYNIAKDIAKEGGHARELLFLASRPRGTARSKAACACAQGCHTSFPVEIALRAQALDLGTAQTADPQFTFTLCRVGTNKNGDHFLAEELAGRFTTAVNKKIDLQHSQEFSDIVGGVVSADYVEDETGGRVECVGELYTGESEQARLAHKLIRKGIISQVSMECDYAEGECSICAKRVKSKADYCVHLAKYKGAEFQGKPVFEILHGVTFTGLGLLDRKGADENARITQVASEAATTPTGGPTMDGKEAADAAKKKDGGDGGEAPPPDDKARVKELDRENKELKAQVSELQKRVQELEAEQKSAANRARAQKLLRKLEKQGLAFGSDEERETELGRLAKLTDEAFTATEAAYDRAVPKRADAPEKPGKTKAREDDDPPLRTDAGVRPLSIDDKKLSLEDRLKTGFRAAHDARRARLTGTSADTD